ncbi:MAG: tyrosine-type recombinase/integrase [Aquabacterium sp.]
MLSDLHCRTAKARDRLYRLNDRDGLYLEVKPNGVKAFRYRFKLGGKESMMGLGEYPATTLSEARTKAQAARKLVKEGVSPVHQKQLDRANTLEVIAAEWLATKDWEDVTKKRRIDMLRRVVFPSLGNTPIRNITSHQVLHILQTTHARGAPSVAAEAKRTLSSIFQFAVSTLRTDTDPVWPVRNALPKNKTQHKTALTKDQVSKLLGEIDGHKGNFSTVQAFRLLWYSLLRANEVAAAEWSEVDLEKGVWTIPAGRMKGRRAHSVPITIQMRKIFESMKPQNSKHKYVFTGRDSKESPLSIATFRQFLYKNGWSGTFSPHGVRTTGSTMLHEMGYRSELIEAQLAHLDQNQVRRTYNHTDYILERAKMMQYWCDFLDQISGNSLQGALT